MPQEVGLFTAEDSALKEKLSGIVVSDDREPSRTVGVHYRYPEADAIEKAYPFIVIDLLDVRHAVERETSAQTIYARGAMIPATGDPMRYKVRPGGGVDPGILPYWPDEVADIADLPDVGDFVDVGATIELTPVDFMYQVTTYTRNYAHDRQIHRALFGRGRLPFRYGTLFVDADGTSRRLTHLGWNQSDYHDGEAANRKRIFRKIITLTVSGEMGYAEFVQTRTVDEVVVNVNTITDAFGA